MEKYELQRLRDLPIEGVAERLGLQVNRRHKCLCPFHDDHHASLSFCTRRNSFRCFVCDAHGGTIDLVMRYLHKDFKEACAFLGEGRWMKNENGNENLRQRALEVPPRGGFRGALYSRFFEHPFWNPEARHFLFNERHLNTAVISWLRITSYYDRNHTPWLQTPYYDEEGKLIGVQSRRLGPLNPPLGDFPTQSAALPQRGSGEGAPRFRFPPGSKCAIYNLPILNYLKEDDELWITEGCSDCWAMLSAGKKAIAIPSATLLGHEDEERLQKLRSRLRLKWGMYPDNDAPGERLFLKLKEIIPELTRHQLPSGCKDFADYYLRLKLTEDNGQQQ